MTNCKDKISESHHFLTSLINSQTDHNSFQYTLSAFLASFRSIYFYLEEESKANPEFRSWLNTIKAKLTDNEKTNLLKTKRNLNIHKGPVKPRAEISTSIQESVSAIDHLTLKIVHADGTIEKFEDLDNAVSISVSPEILSEDKWLWYFDNYPDLDVISICKECLTIMEEIVAEYETKF